jgi:hypothetical protein
MHEPFCAGLRRQLLVAASLSRAVRIGNVSPRRVHNAHVRHPAARQLVMPLPPGRRVMPDQYVDSAWGQRLDQAGFFKDLP